MEIMEGSYVTIAVHNEFAKRMDETNERHEERLTNLEIGLKEVNKITASVERLVTQIENLAKEISKQGQRLEEIEKKPAKRWDVVITGAISAIVGALMAAMMSGMFQ